MRPKGSAETLEMRRRIAARLLKAGKGIRETARLVGASPSSVWEWKRRLEEGGEAALKARPRPKRKRRLSEEQQQRLSELLIQGPRAAGFPTDLWTLKRVAQVIEREFGIRYHPAHVWRILRDMGFSYQKPERRARERDEEAIRRWRETTWETIKKSPG